jgi:asparagine synthase (glutamine-hydrolysing)
VVAAGANLVLRKGALERYSAVMECFPPSDLEAAGLPVPTLGSFPAGADTMAIDQRTLLLDCFLPKADSMTMAHGVEERVPFLDLQVVAAARVIPLADKLGPPEKRILREAARGHVPDAVRKRAKRGYGTPMEAWGTAFEDRIAGSLAAPRAVAAGLLDQGAWDALVRGSRAQPVQRLRPSWLLFALDEWLAELHRRNVLA